MIGQGRGAGATPRVMLLILEAWRVISTCAGAGIRSAPQTTLTIVILFTLHRGISKLVCCPVLLSTVLSLGRSGCGGRVNSLGPESAAVIYMAENNGHSRTSTASGFFLGDSLACSDGLNTTGPATHTGNGPLALAQAGSETSLPARSNSNLRWFTGGPNTLRIAVPCDFGSSRS